MLRIGQGNRARVSPTGPLAQRIGGAGAPGHGRDFPTAPAPPPYGTIKNARWRGPARAGMLWLTNAETD